MTCGQQGLRSVTTLLLSVCLLSPLIPVTQAQITLDGSLGGTRGALQGPNFMIPSTVGSLRGPNLFHSFGQFNLASGESATFTGPNTVVNILSRVTGGSPSSIDGTIRSQIPGANFYLINPRGVLFGPNASLDISGSFHVSTADAIRLQNGGVFHADLTKPSVLTTAPPAAFGFLQENPAAITIQGSTLRVAQGQTLSVVGGNIRIEGDPSLPVQDMPTLGAPGGTLRLVSVAAPGDVALATSELSPAFQGISAGRLGEMTISNALLDASGDGGGTVTLRAGRLLVDQSFVFADNLGKRDGVGLGVDFGITAETVLTNRTSIRADSRGAGRARDLWVTAESLRMEGAFLGSTAQQEGQAGSVVVEAPRITLTGGAQIRSPTFGAGRGAGPPCTPARH